MHYKVSASRSATGCARDEARGRRKVNEEDDDAMRGKRIGKKFEIESEISFARMSLIRIVALYMEQSVRKKIDIIGKDDRYSR